MKFQSILTAGKWCSYTGKQDWFLVFHDKQFKNGHDNSNNQQKKTQNAKSSHKFKPTCNKKYFWLYFLELKNFNINIETNLFIWFKRNILFQSISEATRKFYFFVSPLASLYIMMIFLFIICDWIDSFSVILYAL